MKKQSVLVCMLAGALVAVTDQPAAAQHTAPNQQPVTIDAANAPTGEIALGSVRLPRSVTADGKPLAAGTYQVRADGPDRQAGRRRDLGTARALGRVRPRRQGRRARSRQHRPAG